jgi:uncharacterized protein YdeI (YjbR/CyaY-like superfamily)
MSMNPKVDLFLRDEAKWRDESKLLRKIALGSGLTEELKWGKPCYTFRDSNVVIIQGFKEYCALLFCKGVLLKDPKGVLNRIGKHTQGARQIRFTNAREVVAMKPVVMAYIREAIEVEKAGLKVEYKRDPEPIPKEFQYRLDYSPALKAAFFALTPGRQRFYIIYFSAPKQSKTRDSRIEKFIGKILQGKGFHD